MMALVLNDLPRPALPMFLYLILILPDSDIMIHSLLCFLLISISYFILITITMVTLNLVEDLPCAKHHAK